MAFAVFMHREDSPYDDIPESQYQFPQAYLSRVTPAVGDWIVYLEGTKVRRSRGYFAVAKVATIVPDPRKPQHYLALIEQGSFLEFVRPVPFSGGSGYVEKGVLNQAGRVSGRAQSAVRALSAPDFSRIVSLGLPDNETVLPRSADPGADPTPQLLAEDQTPFEIERDVVQHLVNRKKRDRWFRRDVLQAYDCRCALTGWKIINGGGRAEVAAAHIRPVEQGGPDSVRNGLALSGTTHWMFDRGLISLADDLSILISRQVNNREEVERIIHASGKAVGPSDTRHAPHPEFLKWHRRNCFKA
jgi:putative restriction endonuclease